MFEAGVGRQVLRLPPTVCIFHETLRRSSVRFPRHRRPRRLETARAFFCPCEFHSIQLDQLFRHACQLTQLSPDFASLRCQLTSHPSEPIRFRVVSFREEPPGRAVLRYRAQSAKLNRESRRRGAATSGQKTMIKGASLATPRKVPFDARHAREKTRARAAMRKATESRKRGCVGGTPLRKRCGHSTRFYGRPACGEFTRRR